MTERQREVQSWRQTDTEIELETEKDRDKEGRETLRQRQIRLGSA